jgi:hypothetical protein
MPFAPTADDRRDEWYSPFAKMGRFFGSNGNGFAEDAQDFARTVGHRQKSAPVADRRKAILLLKPEIALHFLFGADDDDGEHTRIGIVEAIEIKTRTVDHGSDRTPLKLRG